MNNPIPVSSQIFDSPAAFSLTPRPSRTVAPTYALCVFGNSSRLLLLTLCRLPTVAPSSDCSFQRLLLLDYLQLLHPTAPLPDVIHFNRTSLALIAIPDAIHFNRTSLALIAIPGSGRRRLVLPAAPLPVIRFNLCSLALIVTPDTWCLKSKLEGLAREHPYILDTFSANGRHQHSIAPCFWLLFLSIWKHL